MSTTAVPNSCDFLVVGAGATALAFCDSLLLGWQMQHQKNTAASSDGAKLPSIVLIDPHEKPGGQWIDSYAFVQLHQPSAMYGVESLPLEPTTESAPTHRATRVEILNYYERVIEKWRPYISFVGRAKFDFANLPDPGQNVYRFNCEGSPCDIRVRSKVVDARYLQPDLPIDTPPRFQFNGSKVHCVPLNDLVAMKATEASHYVVIGGGKSGMDAVYFLLTTQNVTPDRILWIMPHDAWITARESIGNCMEFIHTALVHARRKTTTDQDLVAYVQSSPDCLQDAFLQWEQEGKVYRLDRDRLPTKFKDATLSLTELKVLQTVTNVVRGKGRVTRIADDGSLHFTDGSAMELPWKNDTVETIFVHCSAGAFNYTKQPHETPPIFKETLLTIQDVYGTPGFCFVGSIMGKLESLSNLTLEEKNALCLAPSAAGPSPSPLGPSGGDIGTLSPSHGFVQRLQNVRAWLKTPELRHWLVGHRLFNLGHCPNAAAMEAMVEETWTIASLSGLCRGSK